VTAVIDLRRVGTGRHGLVAIMRGGRVQAADECAVACRGERAGGADRGVDGAGQVARCADALADVGKLIKTLITVAAMIGVEETSINIAGKAHWLHVARTDELTAYHRHDSRGREAVAKFGVLPTFTGTAVHDALSVYDCYPARHALCSAHIIRELTAADEAHPGEIWPVQARSALAQLGRLASQAREEGRDAIPARQRDKQLRLYRQAIQVGLHDHPRVDGRKQSKTRNLLERLRDRETEMLRFTRDLDVPHEQRRRTRPAPGQVTAEDLRLSPLRTRRHNWLRVRGYISTVRKHGDDVLTAIRDAITGNPWTPPMPAMA
jgi:transposase